MAAHPVPSDLVLGQRGVEASPQLGILHRLLVGGAPAVAFPAVNLAARLEKIVAKLGRTVIASEKFTQQCAADVESLGEFSVAGFAGPQTAYGLRDEAGGAPAQPAAIREAGLSPAAP